jgi:hypothetical protein
LIPKISNLHDQVVLFQHLLQPFVCLIVDGITKIKAPQDLDKLARKEIKSTIAHNLDILARIIKKLDPVSSTSNEHFFIAILGELWPLMDSVMDYYFDSTEIMESVCKLMKHSMGCLQHLFGQFFERYFTTITRNYERYPLATYLYSVENALTTYCTSPTYVPMLSQLYSHMIKKTQVHLSTSDPKKQDPDLIDDFFGLITRFLRKLPSVVVSCQTDVAESQFKVAVQCIGITMEGPIKALYQYFDEVFTLFDTDKILPGKEEFLQTFTNNGYAEAVLVRSIQFLVEDCPDRYICKFFYDIFYAILKYCRQLSIPWFINGLKTVVPANVLTNLEKEKFVQGLQTKDFFSEKEFYTEFLDEFFTRCRTNSSLKH